MESRKQLVNEDLDRYIASRKKRAPWTGVFAREKKMEPTTPVQPYKEEQVSEEEYEESKGFFAKLAERLFGETPPAEAPTVQEPELSTAEVSSDMKELARISLSIIKQLPPEQVQEFKQTQDFERFKEILRKHKIIK